MKPKFLSVRQWQYLYTMPDLTITREFLKDRRLLTLKIVRCTKKIDVYDMYNWKHRLTTKIRRLDRDDYAHLLNALLLAPVPQPFIFPVLLENVPQILQKIMADSLEAFKVYAEIDPENFNEYY